MAYETFFPMGVTGEFLLFHGTLPRPALDEPGHANRNIRLENEPGPDGKEIMTRYTIQ